jgi:hypothetical protein
MNISQAILLALLYIEKQKINDIRVPSPNVLERARVRI